MSSKLKTTPKGNPARLDSPQSKDHEVEAGVKAILTPFRLHIASFRNSVQGLSSRDSMS